MEEDVNILRRRMQEIIDAKMPIRRYMVPTEDAIALFQEKGDVEKVKLLKTSGSIYTTYYKIGEFILRHAAYQYFGALSLRIGEVLRWHAAAHSFAQES